MDGIQGGGAYLKENLFVYVEFRQSTQQWIVDTTLKSLLFTSQHLLRPMSVIKVLLQ